MEITRTTLAGISTGFQATFNSVLNAPTRDDYEMLVIRVPSMAGENAYPFLSQLPGMRKWVGDRVVKNLTTEGYVIRNETYEDTIEVSRTAIEDDQYGVYRPMFEGLAAASRALPNQLVFDLMTKGFETPCYDGQYFFDTDHPVTGEDGKVKSLSNVQAGSSSKPWFLVDLSKAQKPFILQERVKPMLTRKDRDEDDSVFLRDSFLYGTRCRIGVGYGLWQTAYASAADLTAANFQTAIQVMQAVHGDGNRPLGINPTHLVAATSQEGAVRELLMSERDAAGATNKWRGRVEMILTPWLN